ncbi:MAG: hypothetical protein EHJ95_05745, partial [Methanobacteriota archaeon]
MRPATLEFLKQRFAEYYRKGVFALPPALEEREWGFIFFDPAFPEIRMRRHIGFGSRIVGTRIVGVCGDHRAQVVDGLAFAAKADVPPHTDLGVRRIEEDEP